MNEQLWRNFEKTGSIVSYLEYKGVSIGKDYNCHGENDSDGNCAHGNTCR